MSIETIINPITTRKNTNQKTKQQFTVLELFAGAGGLALGLEKAGFKTIGVVEIDRYACETLRANRPNWRILEQDITQLSQENLEQMFDMKKGTLDLLSGGYPCQAFSYAGQKKGLEDTRGSLFYHYAIFLEKLQPKMFI
ncbi:MAG: DNA cytosine methyltransferase, partial [Brevinema sp.]